MDRVQLFFKDASEIAGSDGFSVIRLVDSAQQCALCVICDRYVTEQIRLRLKCVEVWPNMLPEVLLALMGDDARTLELMVHDVVDGQYHVTLTCQARHHVKSIRMSEAVLLNVISNTPLYIDGGLMQRQSVPYVFNSSSFPIPINSLSTERLNKELQRAVDAEDYELASQIHAEILKRTKP